MANPPIPAGQRFSRNYLYRGEPTADGDRARRRLAALIRQLGEGTTGDLAWKIRLELGVNVPPLGTRHNWDAFLDKAELRDVLDTVTVAREVIAEHDKSIGIVNTRERGSRSAQWIEDVRRIFQEENLRYRIDDSGGVHFAIDDEFEQNNISLIKALTVPRYAAAKQNFESALASLSAVPPATKDAVRNVFAANEGLFRLMFPAAPRLVTAEIERQLRPLLQRLTAGDAAATGATAKLSDGFKDWVDGAHFYRHEQGVEEPTPPSLDMAVLFVSQGASWLRWLAEIDVKSDAPKVA